jgi:hypothetical protein
MFGESRRLRAREIHGLNVLETTWETRSDLKLGGRNLPDMAQQEDFNPQPDP